MIEPETSVLVFSIGSFRLAAKLSEIQEVIRAVWLTPIPTPVPSVSGYFSLRGTLTMAVDLRPHLRCPPQPLHPHQAFLVTSLLDGRVALIVDEVEGMRRGVVLSPGRYHSDEFLTPTPYTLGFLEQQDAPLPILDLESLFRQEVLQQAHAAIVADYRDRKLGLGEDISSTTARLNITPKEK